MAACWVENLAAQLAEHSVDPKAALTAARSAALKAERLAEPMAEWLVGN